MIASLPRCEMMMAMVGQITSPARGQVQIPLVWNKVEHGCVRRELQALGSIFINKSSSPRGIFHVNDTQQETKEENRFL
jgi:hypothetical protein